MLRIYGTVLPKATDNITNIADEFTPQEMKLMRLSGLPIHVDHKGGSVGKILHDWVGEDGRKYVVGEIDTKSSLFAALTGCRIARGALPDFSLTHLFEIGQNGLTKDLYYSKTPVEVSVCR